MANNTSRGGMKQSDEKRQPGKKHQGVRPGSTATRKERRQVENRKPVIDEAPTTQRRKKPADDVAKGQPRKRRQGPAAKKVRREAPGRRSEVTAGAGKKNLYANMPKARKVR